MRECSVLSSHTMSNVLGCIPEKTRGTQPYAQGSFEKGRLWVPPRRNAGDTQQEMANTVDRDRVLRWEWSWGLQKRQYYQAVFQAKDLDPLGATQSGKG